MRPMLCLPCALEGFRLEQAVAVQDGTSMCARHGRPGPRRGSRRRGGRELCGLCAQSAREHVAWFVLDSTPLCIRHTAETVHPDDDMRAHAMAHGFYLQLQAHGESDRY